MVRGTVNEVEQGEQENPHDIDEMPIQSADFDGLVVRAVEVAQVGAHHQPGHDADADDHVNGVQAGHDEVEAEEQRGVAFLKESLLICRFSHFFAGGVGAVSFVVPLIVRPGHVVVVRNVGPVGGPGMPEMVMLTIQLQGRGLGEGVALITDKPAAGVESIDTAKGTELCWG